MADAIYHFLSYVRSGFAAVIPQPDTFGSAQPALATAPVGVTVSGVPAPVTHQAVVRGAGDVIGISRSQVVRTDPIDGAVGVEPNYFALIEFDRPDLPWLFTPAAAVGERLRPWIVLVVLDGEGTAACTVRSGSPLPVLSVSADAGAALPDLTTSYLWAHAQVILPDGVSLDGALGGGADPRLTISRLMCPRHLAPNRWYVAAVVPAFNVGRLAGLGLPVTPADEAQLQPAWAAGAAVDLPVYYSWRFRTGEDADFEQLARQLKGRPLPAGVGARALDVSRPGAGLPSLPAATDVNDTKAITWLDGALRPIDSDNLPKRDAAATQAFQSSLTVLLDQPANLVRSGLADPVVAPPIYGDKHALAVTVDGPAVPPWIGELNLDPRTRVAAGIGTQVIQARQEDYVARAWRQLGDVLAANRLLRTAQFARSSSLRVHARLATLDAPSMLGLTYPAHQRLVGVMPDGKTLDRNVALSRLPKIAVEPAFRRLTRGSTGVGRATALASSVIERFAAQVFSAPVEGPDGSTKMRPAGEVIGAARSVTVLSALGDAQPSDPTRLDTMIATLAASQTVMPTGDTLRALSLRNDVGAVAMTSSLGALPASVISAVLNAAATPAAAPLAPVAPPPITNPPGLTLPVIHPPVLRRASVAPLAHLPLGLVNATATVPGSTTLRIPVSGVAPVSVSSGIGRDSAVFVPSGPSRALGSGAVLRGGSVIIDNPTVQKIASQTSTVQQLDDTRWRQLQQSAGVPAAAAAGDPISDPAARLDLLRRDSAALTALAQTATGNLAAAQVLDRDTAVLATSGAAAATLAGLTAGHFVALVPAVAALVSGADDLAAAHDMVSAVALALDRTVVIADAPPPAVGPTLDLATANSALLTRLDPNITVVARLKGRLDIRVRAGVARRDELDPIVACPQFNDPMWQAVRDLGTDWLLPGLELVPPDTATLVRTNPLFVAAHLVGLNHELMRELLWREYPTDQRGTGFHRFWGRSGEQPDDIGDVHLLRDSLQDLLGDHNKDESVLLLRSELLRRYPGSIVYLCRAMATQADGEPALDDGTLIPPSFRGDLPPDVTFVGFSISPADLRATTDPWYFVIAQPPTEPRFGLDDRSASTTVPTTANDLAWNHMAPDGNPGTPTPFALADPVPLHGHLIDGSAWGTSAAVQAQLTYQHKVRVAIRAADLLPPEVTP
jgi:hypothetical protein